MFKVPHSKDPSVFLCIEDAPVKPVDPLDAGTKRFQDFAFLINETYCDPGIEIATLAKLLEMATNGGFTHVNIDTYDSCLYLRTLPSNEQITKYHTELEKFNVEINEWRNKLKSAQASVQKMYQEKQQNTKQKDREKYSDPEYIEFLRLQDKMRKEGYIK